MYVFKNITKVKLYWSILYKDFNLPRDCPKQKKKTVYEPEHTYYIRVCMYTKKLIPIGSTNNVRAHLMLICLTINSKKKNYFEIIMYTVEWKFSYNIMRILTDN